MCDVDNYEIEKAKMPIEKADPTGERDSAKKRRRITAKRNEQREHAHNICGWWSHIKILIRILFDLHANK